MLTGSPAENRPSTRLHRRAFVAEPADDLGAAALLVALEDLESVDGDTLCAGRVAEPQMISPRTSSACLCTYAAWTTKGVMRVREKSGDVAGLWHPPALGSAVRRASGPAGPDKADDISPAAEN